MRVRAIVLAAFAVLATAAPARAATFTVTGTLDSTTGTCTSGSCTTLRAALAAAAGSSGPDIITLPGVRSPYQVTAGQLTVDSEVTIVGDSAATTTISGDGKSSRVFNVTTTLNVAISHVTIKSGAASSAGDGVGGDILVGQGANVTLDHVRVTAGTALEGGGIGVRPASTLTITKSLIDHNTATFVTGVTSGIAGALLSTGNAKLAGNALKIFDSTIAQNTASQGAGIVLQSNAANQTTLDRVTIALNSGSTNALGNGVSVNDAESVKVGSSIIAGNTGDGVPTNCDTKLTSVGGNIDSGTNCGFAAPADRPATDPQLATVLGTAGGETLVLSIPATSPAVEFAGACTGTDQRDLARPQGKTCDSGAFEVDQAPNTAITSGPSGLVNSTTATFVFSSTDPGSTFQCSLDGAAFSDCSPPQTYNGLGQGAHTLGVRAVDPAGNVDPTPATASWTVDSVPPDTTLTPIATPTNDSTPTFAFSSESGATFQCRVDGAAFAACTSPLTTPALADGSHTFQVRATDAAGNTDATPASQTFVVDTVAPDTTFIPIVSPTNDNTATFTFSSEAGATFQCRVDGAAYAACTSPFTTAALADGSHTFDVRAKDAAGNVDATPGSQTFVVDTVAPDTTLTPIATPTKDATPTFTFTSPDGSATFQCRVDGAAFAACTSPFTAGALGDGSHTFDVRAKDAAGNVDASPASQAFVVDTAPPDTTLTPIASPTNDATPTFSFTSSEAGSTFTCLLDDGDPVACASPYTLPALTDGTHTFSVFATDAAGNSDATPAQQTFTINTRAPTVTFLSAPTAPTNDATPTFTFSASTPATFRCRFDSDPFAGCASPFTPATPLAEGSHTLDVQAEDAAGNVGSASRLVVIDLTPPSSPTVESGPSGVTSDSSPTFTFAPSTGAAAIECSLTGPGQPGTFAPCASPASFSGLAPGDYVFTVRARDAAGNTTTSSRAFTVAVPQQATPTPTPTPTPSPTPVANQSVVVQPAGGTVLVRAKGTNTFVALDATRGIPLGSEVDARHGKVRLSSAPKPGATPQTALFFGGLFVVTQSKGITQLALSEPLAACPRGKAASAAAKKKPKTRSLWGDGHGSFRTKGRYSAATVRGTRWNVQDSCAGTLTRVVRGVVAVNDFARRKTIVLRAGKKYLARPR